MALVRTNVECSSEHESLGTVADFDACRQACEETDGCMFFSFGEDDKACAYEKTSSAACPEGFIDKNKYNFYSLNLDDDIGRVTFDYLGKDGAREQPGIRTMRDIVDLNFQRGCRPETFRGHDGMPSDVPSDHKVCSMNIYQDYFDKQDTQWDVLKVDVGDSDKVDQPNWRNYPSGHVGMAVMADFPSQGKFQANSNIGRRDSVANDRAEYYVAGCIGQVQAGTGDAFDWMSNVRRNPPPAGFVDRDTAFCGKKEAGTCENTTEQRCIEQRDGNAVWNSAYGCLPGRRPGNTSQSLGNLRYKGEDQGSGGNEAYFSGSQRFCERWTEGSGGAKFIRHNFRKDSDSEGGEYGGNEKDDDTANSGHSYKKGDDNEIERACCLGAGTYMQGKLEGKQGTPNSGYVALRGARPLGAPCKVDADCWDGEPGGSVFCHTDKVTFFKWTRDVNKGPEGSTRYTNFDAQTKMDKFGSYEKFEWPATHTCRRRCGVAGKDNSRYENIKDEYGTAWIGATYADSYTINEARVRQGLSAGVGGLVGGPIGAAIGAAIGGAVNAPYIDAMQEQANDYLASSNDNTFECGFQQRWKDWDEDLYFNPVFERADKHDDTVDGFYCDYDNTECEKKTTEQSCEETTVGPGQAACYWNNGKCNSKLYEFQNCGDAYCYGDEHEPKGFVNTISVTAASAFSCLKNCGWDDGGDDRVGSMWTGFGSYPYEDSHTRSYLDFEQSEGDGFMCFEGGRRYNYWEDDKCSDGSKKTKLQCETSHAEPEMVNGYPSWGHKGKLREGFETSVGPAGGFALLRHDCSQSGMGGSGSTGAPTVDEVHTICPASYWNSDTTHDFWDAVTDEEWENFKPYIQNIPVGHFPTAVECASGQGGGDCSLNVEFADRRCFYGFADSTTCWQPPSKLDPGGGRPTDNGALTVDEKCADGWTERTLGLCTKDCKRWYRNFQTVGPGFSHENCAECEEVGGNDNMKSACRQMCSKIKLEHCTEEGRQGSKDACEVAGSGCRWRADFDSKLEEHLATDPSTNCIDPTLVMQHTNNGHICQEKCGIHFDHGPGWLATQPKDSGERTPELCNDKIECTQWQSQRCYKACGRDQVEVGLEGHAYLCRDSCERHMAKEPGACTVRIKTKEGKDYITRPANNNFTGTDAVNLQEWVTKVFDPKTYSMVEGANCELIRDETTCKTDDRATSTKCVWSGDKCISPENLNKDQIDDIVAGAVVGSKEALDTDSESPGTMYTAKKKEADAVQENDKKTATDADASFATTAADATQATNTQASSDKSTTDADAKEAEAQAARDQATADAEAAEKSNREKGGCEVAGENKPPKCERDSAFQNPESRYQSGFGCALPGDEKKEGFKDWRRAREVWGVCWEDAPTKCEQCRNDNTNGFLGLPTTGGDGDEKGEDDSTFKKQCFDAELLAATSCGMGICSPPSGQARLEKHKSMRTKTECEDEGNTWTAPVEEAEFESCMTRESERFEKENEDCCSCDVGALYQSTCPASKPTDWTDIDNKKRKKPGGWYWLGGVCWQECPPGYADAGVWCLEECSHIVDRTCTGIEGEEAEDPESWICKHEPGWSQQGTAGAHWCWANELSYERGAGYAWQWGDGFSDSGMRERCKRDDGWGKGDGHYGPKATGPDGEFKPQSCEKNGLILYPTCKEKYHNDACCFCSKDGPWSFTPQSLGGHKTKASWVTTQAKASFVPRTDPKESYTPYSWGMSTYPMVRPKNSFVPVSRTRRSYSTDTRAKDLTGNDAYTTGKARGAWWWDKFSEKEGSVKCCMQGCQDASGTFSDGCVEKKKTQKQSLHQQEPYQYPPVCRTVWTPGKPHISVFADTDDGEVGDGLSKAAIKAWGESCGKHFLGQQDDTSKAWCMENVSDATRVQLDGMCYYPEANRGKLHTPNVGDEDPKRFPQLSEENCAKTYKERAYRKCFGAAMAAQNSWSLAKTACEGNDECVGIQKESDGKYTPYKSSETNPFGVRKDPQSEGVSCFVRGNWTDDIRQAADDGVLEGLPETTRLGYVDGWTRKDRRTLLMPYAIPRSVDAGGKKRDIYMLLDDYVDEFKPDKIDFVYESTRGEGYTLTKDQAQEVCKAEGETLCPKSVVEKQRPCNYGWTSDTDAPGYTGSGVDGCGGEESEGVWLTNSDGLGNAHCCKTSGEGIGKWIRTPVKRLFRTMAKSDDYDRFENHACGSIARGENVSNITDEQQCADKCSTKADCFGYEWHNESEACTLMGKGMQVAEEFNPSGAVAALGTVCAVAKENPRVVRDERNRMIGFEVLLEQASPPDWWSADLKNRDRFTSDPYLRDTINELKFGDMTVPLPVVAHVDPGSQIRLGRVATDNRFEMKRWQASALHGGDMCRYWMVGNMDNTTFCPAFADGSCIPDAQMSEEQPFGPMYAKLCDQFRPDDTDPEKSMLRNAIEWCNGRVENTQGSTEDRFRMRNYRNTIYNAWKDGECSDTKYKTIKACENAKRGETDAVKAAEVSMRDLQKLQRTDMLENMPSCLPDRYSNFFSPARACPRWSSAGSSGEFCRKIARAFPLQYDGAINRFCANANNALLPACDCLRPDVVAKQTKSNNPKLPEYCMAAPGSEIADNYEARSSYCQAQQVLGESLVNVTGPYRTQLHDRCFTGAQNTHILRPKIVLNTTTTEQGATNTARKCIDDWESSDKFCKVKNSGCSKLPSMPNICLNIVNQTIENCIIVDPSPESACGIIDKVEQNNNCCATNDCGSKNSKEACGKPCRWNTIANTCESGCIEKNIVQSTTKNRINVKGLAAKENQNPNMIGPHTWNVDGNVCSDPRFPSEPACAAQYERHGSTRIGGDPFQVGQGTALDAAALCATKSNCTGFVMRGNTDFALMQSSDELTTAAVEFTTYVAAG